MSNSVTTSPIKPAASAAPRKKQEDQLRQTLALQRRAIAAEAYPSYAVRSGRLKRLSHMIKDNQPAIIKALTEDFGHRAAHETRMVEIVSSLASIDYMQSQLRRLMNRRKRSTSIWFLPGKNYIAPQPLGIIGIMSPWNYPVNLAISPLAAALAAGNRAVIRMSEYTPATTALIASLIARTFKEDEVAVYGGDAEFAAYFSRQKFDHILFTGSTRVGRHVMMAAAENLTPVTLELGGKSLVIIAPDYDIKEAAERIAWGKVFNAGQTCIAPDYAFVPRDKIDIFAKAVIGFFENKITQDNSEDYTSIINERFYARLNALVKDAKDQGAKVLEAAMAPQLVQSANRAFPLTIIISDNPDALIAQEEIFGPILLVQAYDDMSDAVDYINARAHPLALYLFTHSPETKDQIIQQTTSGGVAINEVMLHFLQVDMPFGGVGGSGFGKYHGAEGFETFSNMKPVFEQKGIGKFTGLKTLYPPYGKLANIMIKLMQG